MGKGISSLMIITITAPLTEHPLNTLLFTVGFMPWLPLSASDLTTPPPPTPPGKKPET